MSRYRLMTNATLWLILAVALLGFIPFAMFMERQNLFEFMNLLLVAIAAGTAVGFQPAAFHALKAPVRSLTAGQVLVVSLVLASLAMIVIFTGQWFWRYYSKLDTIGDHIILAFSRWFLLISWIMALLASGSDAGPLPSSTYKRAGLFVFIAIALFGLLMSLNVIN